MRRPPSEGLRTLVLVVVLVVAGSGVALVALTRPDGEVGSPTGTGTSSASVPAVTPEPSPPRPSPSRTDPSEQPEATAAPCRAPTERVALRVLTLNTHGAQGRGGFDLDRLASFLRATDVDVALLQEVDRFRGRSRYSDMPRVLAARTGMEVAYGLNVDLRGRAVSGTATLSRYPILSQRNVRLPGAPGAKGRGLLRTDLDVDGVRVSVFNTHLEHLAARLRLRQAGALRGPVAATPHPAVLGGDLNAVPTSTAAARVRRLLNDSWEDAGRGPGPTAPAGSPRRRIDYLYHSPALRVGSIAVLGPVVSDHRAVQARYLLTVSGDEVCVPEPDGSAGGSGPGSRAGRGAGGAR